MKDNDETITSPLLKEDKKEEKIAPPDTSPFPLSSLAPDLIGELSRHLSDKDRSSYVQASKNHATATHKISRSIIYQKFGFKNLHEFSEKTEEFKQVIQTKLDTSPEQPKAEAKLQHALRCLNESKTQTNDLVAIHQILT